jgi:hypothetical protein
MHEDNETHPDIEQAFREVLRWIGEDPDRDGLRETPARLIRAYQEYFSGYRQDPEQILRKTFEETDGYDEMVVLRGIPFESHWCITSPHYWARLGIYVPNRQWLGFPLGRVVGPMPDDWFKAPRRRLPMPSIRRLAAGRGRRDQGSASLHVEPRRSHAWK